MTTTYALWGTGDLARESVGALFEEFMPHPSAVGAIYRPEHVTRDMTGMRNALDWLDYFTDLAGGEVTPTTNILASLDNDRDEHGDEPVILALWPDTPGHSDFDFIEEALRMDIRVIDISRAWDDLDLSLYSRPEPTKEEKAAARAEARASKAAEKKRATSAKKLSDEVPGQEALPFTEVPDGPVAGPSIETMERVIASLPTEKKPPPAPYVEIGVTEPTVPLATDVLYEEARLWAAVEEAKAALDKALREYMDTVTVAMIPVREDVEARTDDRPPFDGPMVGEGTKDYYYTKTSNSYRPAKGKPRRGDILVHLTDAEALEKGGQALLDAHKTAVP